MLPLLNDQVPAGRMETGGPVLREFRLSAALRPGNRKSQIASLLPRRRILSPCDLCDSL